MITAKEAKELYEGSGPSALQFLRLHVDEKVRDAAAAGRRSVIVHMGCVLTNRQLETLPLHQKVIELLIELGYTAKMDWYGNPVFYHDPGQTNGGGPTYRKYGIIIEW